MLQILASSSSPLFHRFRFIGAHSSILARIFRFVRSFPPFRAVFIYFLFFFSLSLSFLLQSIPVFRITFYTQLLFIKAIRRLEYIDRTVTRVHYHPENHGCSCRVRTKKRERKKKTTRGEWK